MKILLITCIAILLYSCTIEVVQPTDSVISRTDSLRNTTDIEFVSSSSTKWLDINVVRIDNDTFIIINNANAAAINIIKK